MSASRPAGSLRRQRRRTREHRQHAGADLEPGRPRREEAHERGGVITPRLGDPDHVQPRTLHIHDHPHLGQRLHRIRERYRDAHEMPSCSSGPAPRRRRGIDGETRPVARTVSAAPPGPPRPAPPGGGRHPAPLRSRSRRARGHRPDGAGRGPGSSGDARRTRRSDAQARRRHHFRFTSSGSASSIRVGCLARRAGRGPRDAGVPWAGRPAGSPARPRPRRRRSGGHPDGGRFRSAYVAGKVSRPKAPVPLRGAPPPSTPRGSRTVSRTVLAVRGMFPHRRRMHPAQAATLPQNDERPVIDRPFEIAGAGFEPATFGL